jgi:large subunit ribosomal protein L22
MNTDKKTSEHVARACTHNIPVSTKHTIEICTYLRYKSTKEAKSILEKVIAKKAPIPFVRFKRNVGHKAGIAAGRFPVKAAKEMLQMVKSVEANAQFKGLNVDNLKITKILANHAPIPFTGNRQHRGTKRTHVEIEVAEFVSGKKESAQIKKPKVEAHAEKAHVTENDNNNVSKKPATSRNTNKK